MPYDWDFVYSLKSYMIDYSIEIFENEKTNYKGFKKTKIMFLRVRKL